MKMGLPVKPANSSSNGITMAPNTPVASQRPQGVGLSIYAGLHSGLLRFSGALKPVPSVDVQTIAPLQEELVTFRKVLLDCVDGETTHLGRKAAEKKINRERYDHFRHDLGCPMWGQCVPVSLLVQYKFGGSLVRYELEVEIDGEPDHLIHYANVIDGVEYDLTSEQLGGDGLHAIDDPIYGALGNEEALYRDSDWPVRITEVTAKKSTTRFYLGEISSRTKLLIERVEAAGVELPHKPES